MWVIGSRISCSESSDQQGVDREIIKLSGQITKQARTEREKAEAIFEWVAKNIAYDVEGLLADERPDQSSVAVLQQKKGVCQGYAALYRDLARSAGLDCEIIPGVTRKHKDPTRTSDQEGRHAWNAVSVDGRWVLLDATWGAGFANRKTKKFRFEFKDYWFDVSPQDMLHSHFPDDVKWQLTSPAAPIDIAQFEKLPLARRPYFELGLKAVSHAEPVFEVKNQVTLTMASDQEIDLTASLKLQNGQDLNPGHVRVKKEGKSFLIWVSLPQPGTYRLKILAGRQGHKRHHALDYIISASVGGGRPLPELGKRADEAGLRFDSHPWSEFEVQDQVTLHFSADGLWQVSTDLRNSDDSRLAENHALLFQDGENFRIEATFPRPGRYELPIFMRRTKDDEKVFAASYQIISRSGGGSVLPTVQDHQQLRELSPLRPLRRGRSEQLEIRTTGWRDAYARVDGERVQLKVEGDLIAGQVKPVTGDDVVVFAKSEKSDTFKSVLTYKVQP